MLNRDPSQAWALENSVDYADLVALVQKMAQTEYQLLEELGQGILEAVGERYSEVDSAKICIAKPHIHIAGAKLESCSVELSRVFRH
jgi:FolB domain-containing protein